MRLICWKTADGHQSSRRRREEVAMRILFTLLVLFTTGSDAWAWGDQGHKVICEIAMRLVQPTTRAEIRR
jgi:hypothetical protein